MVVCHDIHVDQLSNLHRLTLLYLHRVTLLYLGLSICVVGGHVLLNILPNQNTEPKFCAQESKRLAKRLCTPIIAKSSPSTPKNTEPVLRLNV